ncbi:class I SAM-dependent methyltransferase [Methylomonas sp. AM2-LC]|uniref:class I SAM-dependent methyltransferase n=1 Tax=Methylomonas sp. AM2-LC TaxID=3153301 RepID=UPI0032672312
MSTIVAERLFDGPIAEEYNLLHIICPAAADISQRIGEFVGHWKESNALDSIEILEIGCGTGFTTKQLLRHSPNSRLTGIDNAPDMLEQAAVNLNSAISENFVSLLEVDALSHLQATPSASLDVVASAYAIHNFLDGYREQVLHEIYRVLKPGGLFVNGDRYAVDNSLEHLRLTQAEAREYCQVFTKMQRPDLLAEWIVHLFSDESPDHIMRLQPALQSMQTIGFQAVTLHYRQGVNALISGTK